MEKREKASGGIGSALAYRELFAFHFYELNKRKEAKKFGARASS
jgi:hypothetical protein